MRSQTMWSRIRRSAVSSLSAILLSSWPVAAQSTAVVHEGADGSDYTARWVGATAGQVGDFDVIAASPGLGAVVKNTPYSAEAVSEMVQTLGDGTRIVRTSTSSVSRDWAGRTRREHGLTVIGPLASSPDADKRIITISDPEAGVTYMLNPQTRTARKMTTDRLIVSGGPDLTQPGESHGVLTLQLESRSAVGFPGGGADRHPHPPHGSRFSDRIAGHAVDRGCARGGHAYDDDDPDESNRQRPAYSCRVGALVFAGPAGAGDEQTIRPALRRNDVPPYQYRP